MILSLKHTGFLPKSKDFVWSPTVGVSRLSETTHPQPRRPWQNSYLTCGTLPNMNKHFSSFWKASTTTDLFWGKKKKERKDNQNDVGHSLAKHCQKTIEEQTKASPDSVVFPKGLPLAHGYSLPILSYCFWWWIEAEQMIVVLSTKWFIYIKYSSKSRLWVDFFSHYSYLFVQFNYQLLILHCT